jgi:hypothetical protein
MATETLNEWRCVCPNRYPEGTPVSSMQGYYVGATDAAEARTLLAARFPGETFEIVLWKQRFVEADPDLFGKFEPVEGKASVVQIPVDARAWELYDIPGSENAAKRLTSALRRAINAGTKAEAVEIMEKALDADEDFGTADTEPRAEATQCLQIARGEHFSDF